MSRSLFGPALALVRCRLCRPLWGLLLGLVDRSFHGLICQLVLGFLFLPLTVQSSGPELGRRAVIWRADAPAPYPLHVPVTDMPARLAAFPGILRIPPSTSLAIGRGGDSGLHTKRPPHGGLSYLRGCSLRLSAGHSVVGDLPMLGPRAASSSILRGIVERVGALLPGIQGGLDAVGQM